METIGLSFQPGGDEEERRKKAAMVPQAIKVLSLRLPRILGAQAPAPEALLRSQGGGGLPSAIVDNILRTIAPQAQGGPQAAPAGAGGAIPSPAMGSSAGPATRPAVNYGERGPAMPSPLPSLGGDAGDGLPPLTRKARPNITLGPDPFGPMGSVR